MKKYTVIWDLDGTLYEDEHHFDFYMARLTEYRPEQASDMWRDYHAALKGEHCLRMGLAYDVARDLILKVRNSRVLAAWNWRGEPQPLPYTNPVKFNMTDMLSIGDQWWVAGAIAKHYGVEPEESHAAFLATREFMMTPAYTVTQVPGLTELLLSTREQASHILLTNSPEHDSTVILGKLGLVDCFDRVSFLAQKPTRSEEHFARAIKDATAPAHVISVGDNFENEIAPALTLGCQAVFIDRLHLSDGETPRLFIVRNTSGAIEQVRSLLN